MSDKPIKADTLRQRLRALGFCRDIAFEDVAKQAIAALRAAEATIGRLRQDLEAAKGALGHFRHNERMRQAEQARECR